MNPLRNPALLSPLAWALCGALASGPAQAQFASWAAVPNVQVLGGDFNGDGVTDIALIGGDPSWWQTMPVAFSNRDGSFRVTNAGVGDFAAWAAVPNVKVLVGDFNGDRKSDVALIGGDPSWWHTMPVALSVGDANGSFDVRNRDVGNFAAWAATPNVDALAADFDGDGRSDVLLVGGDPSWWHTFPLAVSNGDGSFRIRNPEAGVFAVRAGVAGTRKVVGDFNGDGKADVAVVGSAASGTLPVAFSRGLGRFDVRDAAVGDFAAWGAVPGVKVLVGDFDGDRRDDIALIGGDPAWWTTIPVAFSNGDGTFRISNVSAAFNGGNLSALAAHPAARVVVGDTNGDRRADITVVGADTRIYTATSLGDGRFGVTSVAAVDFAARSHETGVRAVSGDFNGDGRVDVALAGNAFWHALPTAFGNGNGSWTTRFSAVQPPLQPAALPARAWVTTSSFEPFANRCVPGAYDSLRTMNRDPAYVMAYRSGSDTASVWAPTTGNGLTHRQGIQRINRAGRNYLAVTMSTNSGTPAGLEIVAMGSRGGTLGPMGGNVQPMQLPPSSDAVRTYLADSAVLDHVSGFQIAGEYAIVPMEAENDSVVAGFRIARLSDPAQPVWSGYVPRQRNHVTDAGAAGLVRLQGGRFLALVFGYDSGNVETFVSTGTEMPGFGDTSSTWLSMAETGTPFGDLRYQNIQLLTDCDGQLYIVGTDQTQTLSEDWADLWRVDLRDDYTPVFTKLAGASLHAVCSSANTGSTRYCDFSAGAGIYVDGAGELVLYGVEHYNDAVPNTTRAVKVREFN